MKWTASCLAVLRAPALGFTCASYFGLRGRNAATFMYARSPLGRFGWRDSAPVGSYFAFPALRSLRLRRNAASALTAGASGLPCRHFAGCILPRALWVCATSCRRLLSDLSRLAASRPKQPRRTSCASSRSLRLAGRSNAWGPSVRRNMAGICPPTEIGSLSGYRVRT